MERTPVLPLAAVPAALCPTAAIRLLGGDGCGPAGPSLRGDKQG